MNINELYDTPTPPNLNFVYLYGGLLKRAAVR